MEEGAVLSAMLEASRARCEGKVCRGADWNS